MPELSKCVLQVERCRRGMVENLVVSSVVSSPRPHRRNAVTVHARQASRLRAKANPRDPSDLQNKFRDACSQEPRRGRLRLEIRRLAGNESLLVKVVAVEGFVARRESVRDVA